MMSKKSLIVVGFLVGAALSAQAGFQYYYGPIATGGCDRVATSSLPPAPIVIYDSEFGTIKLETVPRYTATTSVLIGNGHNGTGDGIEEVAATLPITVIKDTVTNELHVYFGPAGPTFFTIQNCGNIGTYEKCFFMMARILPLKDIFLP